ncbi:hypothetical protein ACIPW5_36990 [Streptomyces sp. NPDC090077]|uniref:hypothetical protein n=1 Tax=Streptomyces sp. NPDC090077 TaxID=3365938 RepID=UPI00380FEEB3
MPSRACRAPGRRGAAPGGPRRREGAVERQDAALRELGRRAFPDRKDFAYGELALVGIAVLLRRR